VSESVNPALTPRSHALSAHTRASDDRATPSLSTKKPQTAAEAKHTHTDADVRVHCPHLISRSHTWLPAAGTSPKRAPKKISYFEVKNFRQVKWNTDKRGDVSLHFNE